MKTETEIKKELEKQYLHRLQLRIARKMKRSCRNCKFHSERELSLGIFGDHKIYSCSKQIDNNADGCEKFDCIYNAEMIENELLDDIRDPAVCGAKEPKIAALLWVLHEDKQSIFKKVCNFFSKE